MPIHRYNIDLGDITIHIKDARSSGGSIVFRYSNNKLTNAVGCPMLEAEEARLNATTTTLTVASQTDPADVASPRDRVGAAAYKRQPG